jgi:hypothetical protein
MIVRRLAGTDRIRIVTGGGIMDTETSEPSTSTSRCEVSDERRELLHLIPRRSELENLVLESAGYAWLRVGALSAFLSGALKFAQKVFDERPFEVSPDSRTFRGADLLAGARYEDAPAFFELALSDEILQIAADYMGEIPVLMKPRLWLTKPQLPGTEFGGTQLFHRGRPDAPHIRRQAKFLFTMNEVDDESGPFTFLPADVSERILPSYRLGERVSDAETYRHVCSTEAMRLIGPAGTGLMVDTMRCFHFGRRASSKDRLMLMIQFMRHADAPEEDRVERSTAFLDKFGNDAVRKLVMPAW